MRNHFLHYAFRLVFDRCLRCAAWKSDEYLLHKLLHLNILSFRLCSVLIGTLKVNCDPETAAPTHRRFDAAVSPTMVGGGENPAGRR